MKKLLQINVVSDIGSTGRITQQLLRYAEKNGFVPYMAYGFGNSTFKNNFKISSSWYSLHIHGFFGRKMGLEGYFSCFDTWRLIRWIKSIDPDIIHLHNLHGSYLNFKLLFKYLKESNKSVIWTLHDCWAFTGGCMHFTFNNCFNWQTNCYKCNFLKTIYKGNIYGNTAKVLIDKQKAFCGLPNMQIFAVSDWLSSVANQSILKEYNVQTIYNGIDTDVFINNDNDLKRQLGIEDKFMILGIANIWCSRKGLKEFLKLSDVLGEDFAIVLVGLSNSQRNELPKNIIGLLGTNDQKILAEFYSTADVFINFSTEETFGLTVAESLSCGTPAIVMNSTACPELIDKQTGKVVTSGDFEGIIDSLKEIKANGKKYYSGHCRKRIEEKFSLKKMSINYLEKWFK